MLYNFIYILIGIAMLVEGGDYLVKGAVSIAKKFHLSTMVIGLTVVAFGTSAPELLVSIQAAFSGSAGIALGNVVGSNIANIALILGATAAISAVPVKSITLKIDMPFLLFSTILLILAALNGAIERWEGILGLVLLISFVSWQIKNSRSSSSQSTEDEEDEEKPMKMWLAIIIVIISCAALSFGADFLVKGASGIASAMGVSERVIGLTIVAVGTSFPELFASIIAARKGKTDMAIGNVIGSNIFNILCVIGASASIVKITNTLDGFLFDYIFMAVLTILLWLLLRTGHILSRKEGFFLLLIYVLFLLKTLWLTF